MIYNNIKIECEYLYFSIKTFIFHLKTSLKDTLNTLSTLIFTPIKYKNLLPAKVVTTN